MSFYKNISSENTFNLTLQEMFTFICVNADFFNSLKR